MKILTPSGKHAMGWRKQLQDPRDYRYEDFVRAPMAEALPDTVDLSNLIYQVKDQGQLGACVAHGTSSAFEAVQMKANKTATPSCRLLLYRDARIIGGDYPGDNGCNIRDGIQATVKNGVAPETDWGYDISQFDSTPPAKAVSDAVKDETINYYLLDSTAGGAQTLLNIKTCLATTGLPVVYGMPVYQQYEDVGSDGIIDMPSGGSIGGHCNVFFGYQPGYVWTLNSWGTGWGKAFGKFSGGMGLLPDAYVQNYCSDCWTIATESQITPTPTPTPPIAADGTAPAVATTSDGTKHFFCHGTDNALWHRTTTTPWKSLGGVLTSGVSAAAAGTDVYIFARGSNKQNTYYRTLTQPWVNIGGIATSGPGATPNATEPRVSVVVRGSDKALYCKDYDTTQKKWTNWTGYGGIIN